MQDGIW